MPQKALKIQLSEAQSTIQKQAAELIEWKRAATRALAALGSLHQTDLPGEFMQMIAARANDLEDNRRQQEVEHEKEVGALEAKVEALMDVISLMTEKIKG